MNSSITAQLLFAKRKKWLFKLTGKVQKSLAVKIFLILLVITAWLPSLLLAQPFMSDDEFPSVIEIEAHILNAKRSFEGALYTPSTPPPGEPGGTQWKMNPPGSPIWNSNGNQYGDIHSFHFTYTVATGASTWKIDFNRDGDYNDAQESVSNEASSLIGKGFKYVNIWGQGSNSGFTASVTDFTLNDVNFGSFSSSSEVPFSQVFEDADSLFDDITIHGNFSISGDGGINHPRIFVRMANANDAPTCEISSPTNNSLFNSDESFDIHVSASDSTGDISIVEFYKDGLLVGSDNTMPYTFHFQINTSDNFILTARAIDTYGASTTSLPVYIQVNSPPICIIINPVNGAILFDPQVIPVYAEATDQDNNITELRFYLDMNIIGTDSFLPYQNASLVDLPMGQYTLHAQSIDSYGASGLSSLIEITVRCIREDLDNNGIVNTNDFLLFLAAFGDTCSGCNQDFNDDTSVNTFDFLNLLTKIGHTCN